MKRLVALLLAISLPSGCTHVQQPCDPYRGGWSLDKATACERKKQRIAEQKESERMRAAQEAPSSEETFWTVLGITVLGIGTGGAVALTCRNGEDPCAAAAGLSMVGVWVASGIIWQIYLNKDQPLVDRYNPDAVHP